MIVSWRVVHENQGFGIFSCPVIGKLPVFKWLQYVSFREVAITFMFFFFFGGGLWVTQKTGESSLKNKYQILMAGNEVTWKLYGTDMQMLRNGDLPVQGDIFRLHASRINP